VRHLPALLICLSVAACGDKRDRNQDPDPVPAAAQLPTDHAAGDPDGTARAARAASPGASGTAVRPAEPPAPAGEDFTAQAQRLYRLAACGGDGPQPDDLKISGVKGHCAALRKMMDHYRTHWLARAEPFLAGLRPAGLPTSVVYPFGGGDLLTALATYPDATEYTTISLEGSGDPRPVDNARYGVADALALHREQLDQLMNQGWAQTVTLHAKAAVALPGELISALAALAVHDMEPVSLRYFRLEPDGSIHYLTAEDRAAFEKAGGKKPKRHHLQVAVDIFNNAELRFRKRGDPSAPVKIHRHIAFNLDDDHLNKDPSLLAHLQAKGRIAAMTKASGYHFWEPYFSVLRDYFLARMDFMISDSTGLPPAVARKGGFVQETYGTFVQAYHEHGGEKAEKDLARMWQEQPRRKLPIRYGYFDIEKRNNLLVTRRAD